MTPGRGQGRPALSIIIPTLNAAADLPRTLATLEGAIAAGDEVIIVDGGSHDGGPDLARARGLTVIDSPPGRGVQLDAGARAARGQALLFLHADTAPGPGWRQAALDHLAAPGGAERAACFDFALDDPSPRARRLEWWVSRRVRWLALPYGDQGLLISRALYEAIGGYRPLPLMEDVDLVRRLGRRRLARLAVPAVTSARRWRQDGWLARSALNLLCLGLFLVGVPAARIARLYGR
ncbi:MAG: TIGR04283 family arsenosugar biosynthesis glycosyltransferase [Caulobacter sp.]|jgi:rSAM/selenodomain-associated transferase 2